MTQFVELGALLGAVATSLAIWITFLLDLRSRKDIGRGDFSLALGYAGILGPLLGTWWGAAVAYAIHYVATR